MKKAKKTKPTKPVTSHVVIVLDSSGSMQTIRDETIQGFNEQVNAIKKNSKGMKTTVSLVTFSTVVNNPVFWKSPVSKMTKLNRETYRPDGMTAMLDAVGSAIEKLESQSLPKSHSVLFIIISDGQENNSKKFTYRSISEKVQKLTNDGNWTFTYLGSNQDLTKISQELNIPLGNTVAFVNTGAGYLRASGMTVSATSLYLAARKTGTRAVSNFWKQT